MAINSMEFGHDKKRLDSVYSTSSKGSNVAGCRLIKFNFTGNTSSVASAASRRQKFKNTTRTTYHGGDKLQLLSHLTEKKLFKKTKFVSSFPLAAKIYKASSDEFKLKKKSKKNKKSVLTLPNEPSVLPQSCTVSDMNDSEYLRAKEDKPKKRLSLQNKKVTRRNNNYEFYDRDAKYCSQVNIDLDCSSTDIIENFKGDCKNNGKHAYNLKINNDEDVQPHDVWAVLRNINRFQFNPSPPMSEDSTALSQKKKNMGKKGKRKRSSVFETCRTEQYAYISSIDVDSKSRSSFSQSTIIDRITVIDNESEINETCKKIKKKETKSRSPKGRYRGEKLVKNKTRKNKTPQGNNLKAIGLTNNEAINEIITNNEIMKQGSAKTNSKPKTCYDNNDSLILSNVVQKSPSSDDLDGSLYNDDDCFRDSSCVTTEIGFITYSRSESKNCIPSQKDKDKPKIPLAPVSYPKMCGTTRIVPSKGPELRRESPVRKPRLVTTMPSSIRMPKLTQLEIRRRLATIKFPIIILGKDQLSSTIQVEPYDHPQFNGLDNQIWPFMIGWSNKEIIQVKPEPEDARSSAKTRYSSSSSKKTANYVFINKHAVKDKKNLSADKNPSIYKKKETNQTNLNNESKEESPKESKSKPIRQFRDKMLKLLYKKKSDQSVVNSGQGDVSINTTKKFRPRVINSNDDNKFDNMKPTSFKQNTNVVQVPTAPGKLLMPSKHLWGKAKWANDFVENVIKKIKAGTYYNNEIQDSSRSEHHDSKEVSIQTAAPIQNAFDSCGDLTPKITIQRKKESLGYLPGFDSDLPQLEVKSMTRNQISVKHCVTNVMFQFDVALPFESESIMGNIKRSMSCIPLSVTESKTRIFKCKARIVNAMLPAEICTIIPKVISKLQNLDTKLALPPVQKDIVNACLSTISEMPTFEVPSSIKLPLLPHVRMTMKLRLLANGQFLKKSKSHLWKPEYCKKICVSTLMEIQGAEAMELLPKPLINYQYFLETHPASPLPLKLTKLTIDNVVEPETINLCTDLMPLPTKINVVSLPHSLINIQMISGSKSSNACADLVPLLPGVNSISLPLSVLNNLLKFVLPGMPNSMLPSDSMRLPSFMLKIFRNNVILNFNVQEISNTISINAKNYNIDSIYNALANFVSLKSTTLKPSSSVKCIEYIKNVNKENTKVKKNQNGHASSNPIVPNKHRKRKFVRLYKKCKSTSHISAERMSTPLNRITNLEEFFQALGTSKMLSSVMDGYSGRKILASVIEMKSWITDITPRQALMVLLLSNKKDTSNLVRFRPVILQGIAVNRITRASELDMEIEVIEREKFNKLTEHDGTLHLSERANYNDNLLEELCWIAKTTASDYQKPFDDTSEKLLKALLEKRKKLNPSYLRLMARYVGLGLLKSPVKSCKD